MTPEHRVARLYNRSVSVGHRAMVAKRGWQRKMKRSDRIRDLSFALWFRLKGIDPNGPAVFEPTAEFIHTHAKGPSE